ncbi:unnamed protein product [Vitrella brassicaformis CCMP3155]|uniref:Uncharacterized protein n=2 Tax=Vitrella brassicaformis TaxID=1169539 RepID=A0A0G4GX07_VITBC|nr:unnamed protein product [Vitrella brassicaformis CCMP3155]|eukprot:CEM35585.1 unnamed protein product [Vitrella brassicaformis CCMP3155]
MAASPPALLLLLIQMLLPDIFQAAPHWESAASVLGWEKAVYTEARLQARTEGRSERQSQDKRRTAHHLSLDTLRVVFSCFPLIDHCSAEADWWKLLSAHCHAVGCLQRRLLRRPERLPPTVMIGFLLRELLLCLLSIPRMFPRLLTMARNHVLQRFLDWPIPDLDVCLIPPTFAPTLPQLSTPSDPKHRQDDCLLHALFEFYPVALLIAAEMVWIVRMGLRGDQFHINQYLDRQPLRRHLRQHNDEEQPHVDHEHGGRIQVLGAALHTPAVAADEGKGKDKTGNPAPWQKHPAVRFSVACWRFFVPHDPLSACFCLLGFRVLCHGILWYGSWDLLERVLVYLWPWVGLWECCWVWEWSTLLLAIFDSNCFAIYERFEEVLLFCMHDMGWNLSVERFVNFWAQRRRQVVSLMATAA